MFLSTISSTYYCFSTADEVQKGLTTNYNKLKLLWNFPWHLGLIEMQSTWTCRVQGSRLHSTWSVADAVRCLSSYMALLNNSRKQIFADSWPAYSHEYVYFEYPVSITSSMCKTIIEDREIMTWALSYKFPSSMWCLPFSFKRNLKDRSSLRS